MVFKCQEDSFLKEFTTKVVSCEYATLDWAPTDPKTVQKLTGYNVVLEDTILFPEGGGQPCDYGTMNGFAVRNVTRRGAEAVHFVESNEKFEEDAEVRLKLNWERRLDHMQQHSGQHLLSALFEREFNYATTSWWLGSSQSYIELNTPHLINRASLDLIENMANGLIFEGRAVTVALVDAERVCEMEGVRAPRGLPKDHIGLARVVSIDGIESNMCCGTHVSNLTQLQAVKLLHDEKAKDKPLVHFLVGQRLVRRLGECYHHEQQLNVALKCGPAQHLELIEKLQSNLRSAQKSLQAAVKSVAIAEADKVENITPGAHPKFYSLHRMDGIDYDFINTFLRYAPDNILYFLTTWEKGAGGKGHMVLRGDESLVSKFGAQFTDILGGKGNGKENSYQAKVHNSSRLGECEIILHEHFKPLCKK